MMKVSAQQSIKFLRLKRKLNLPSYAAVGVLESIWLFTCSNAPLGDIGKHSDEDIAIAIDWSGDPTELIKVLVECGWLDVCTENRILVHGWEEHCPNYIRGNVKKSGLEFAKCGVKLIPKDAPRDIPRDHPKELRRDDTRDATKDVPRVGSSDHPSYPSLVYPSEFNPSESNTTPPTPLGGASVPKPPKRKQAQEHPLFAEFWQAYPRKTAKPAAATAFRRIDPTPATLAAMLAVIEEQCRSDNWTKDDGQYIPHPATWLNQRRWEDQKPTLKPQPTTSYLPFDKF